MCIIAVLALIRLRCLPKKRLHRVPLAYINNDVTTKSSLPYAVKDDYSFWQRCKLLFRIRPPRPLQLSSFVYRLQGSLDSYDDFSDFIK